MISPLHNVGNNTSYIIQAAKTNPASLSTADEQVLKHSSSPEVRNMKRTSAIECETCKNRKYQDGSDENVSFKAPGHISPQSAGSTVRAHEQEHVANAFAKEGTTDSQGRTAKVMNASVKLQTSTCPECGRTYVSGGTTTTQIKYSDESNPYQDKQKKLDHDAFAGQFVDAYA